MAKSGLKVADPKGLAKKLATYQHPFQATTGFIDMRTMSKNYADNVIPWQDINDLNRLIIGPEPVQTKFDPRTKPEYTLDLCWEPLSNFGILSEIQRDEIPAHLFNIEMNFDGRKVSVILAMEDPVTGRICPFDGHHSARAMDRQGWTHVPCFVLRAPGNMKGQDPYEIRKYLMRVAGEAFLSINLTVKKGVSGYDQFIIRCDFGDPEAVELSNIVKSNGCSTVRISKNAGEISHYPNLWSAYNLLDSGFNKGRYLDMALMFHTYVWPLEPVYGATMVGLANFFHKCEKFKVKLDNQFFKDLSQALISSYKLSKFTHEGYKLAYENAHPFGSAGDDLIVTCGFVHTYNKHVGKVALYTPELQFGVK